MSFIFMPISNPFDSMTGDDFGKSGCIGMGIVVIIILLFYFGFLAWLYYQMFFN